MTWHEAMPLEVRAEMHRLAGGWHFDRMEDALFQGWVRRVREHKDDRWHYRTVNTILRYCVRCRAPFHITQFELRERAQDVRTSDAFRHCRDCRLTMRAGKRMQLFTIDGVTLSLRQWCDRAGVSVETVRSRLRDGDDIWSALRPPMSASERGKMAMAIRWGNAS